MQQYFVNEKYTKDGVFKLVEDDHHHITRVMRMEQGDKIICITNDQKSTLCKIIEITTKYVKVTVVELNEQQTELPIKITIASGIPKRDKLEWTVQKGTELGATEFIPFQATRSISKWNDKKAVKRVERLQKIAKEAAEQSYRLQIPTIAEPATLTQLIEASKQYDYKIVAYEEEAKHSEQNGQAILASVLQNIKAGESLICVFGPEGGLTLEEVQLLNENGFQQCSLGARILRTETAPLYLLVAASYQLELLK